MIYILTYIYIYIIVMVIYVWWLGYIIKGH